MPFNDAVLSGLSIGVPGLVRLLEDVHKRYGKLPWAKLFEPAIRIAEHGFEISPRLHFLLRLDGPASFVPAARRYFFTQGGSALPMGHLLKNPEFAATLRAIAAGRRRRVLRGADRAGDRRCGGSGADRAGRHDAR